MRQGYRQLWYVERAPWADWPILGGVRRGHRRTELSFALLHLSAGLRHIKSHSICRRCGRRSFHNQKHHCAACGYPSAKKRTCTSGMIIVVL